MPPARARDPAWVLLVENQAHHRRGHYPSRFARLADGFAEHASSGRLRVVRQVAGKSREIKVKIDDVVEPGDTVVVKESWF